jgi:hypothetical protein
MLVWLKKYKIIFETIVAVTLTIMGGLVSVAAVIVSVNANRIMSRQYDLDRYGTEPVFTVEWEMGKEDIPYYVIKNVGAEIHSVFYRDDAILNCFYHYPSDTLIRFIFDVEPSFSYMSRHDTRFDEQTQSFRIAANRWFKDKTVADVRRDIETIDDLDCVAEFIKIMIYYRNYRNEDCLRDVIIRPDPFFDDGKNLYGYHFSFDDVKPQPSEAAFVVLIEEDPIKEIQEAISINLAAATNEEYS